MKRWGIISSVLHVLWVIGAILVFVWPGVKFSQPWDGPAVATLVLAAAALILGAVAALAGFLAVWGFATLRDHAGNIAARAANDAMDQAAERAAERVVKTWLNWPDSTDPNEIAKAYGDEKQ